MKVIKTKLLKESNDTHWGMTWDEYENILLNNGFYLIYTKEFNYKNKVELETLYKHNKFEIFVWSTSWENQTSVNSSDVYGFFKGDRNFVSGSKSGP